MNLFTVIGVKEVDSIDDSNESPLKSPDIKTRVVVSFSLGFVIHFSPLAAF